MRSLGGLNHADLSAISAHRRRTDLIDYSHGQQLRSAKRGRRAGLAAYLVR